MNTNIFCYCCLYSPEFQNISFFHFITYKKKSHQLDVIFLIAFMQFILYIIHTPNIKCIYLISRYRVFSFLCYVNNSDSSIYAFSVISITCFSITKCLPNGLIIKPAALSFSKAAFKISIIGACVTTPDISLL